MDIETVDFSSDLQKIGKDNLDCIWILLRSRKTPSPLENKTLQWIDWKLQGQISRFIQEKCREEENTPQVTFLHTMNKLSVPFVAIGSKECSDWKDFRRNCEGLKLQRVLVFCEEDSKSMRLQDSFKKIPYGEYPQVVLWGCEAEG